MNTILISLFSIAWIDMLNPAGISMVMLLIPIVKKHWHVLLFIFGTYIAYLSAGIAVFFGVDRFLKSFYLSLCADYPRQTAIAKLCIGIVCIIGFVLMVRYLVKAAKEHRELSMNDMLKIKSVSPVFIVLLAFGSTWSEIFACVPLLTFIGIMSANNVTVSSAAGYLSVFCIFMMIPLLLIYILYFVVNGEKLQKILNVVRKIMTAFCFYCIPVLFAIGAWWGIKEGLVLFR